MQEWRLDQRRREVVEYEPPEKDRTAFRLLNPSYDRRCVCVRVHEMELKYSQISALHSNKDCDELRKISRLNSAFVFRKVKILMMRRAFEKFDLNSFICFFFF